MFDVKSKCTFWVEMMSVSDLWCIVALKQNELQQIRLVLCCQSNYTDKFICKVLL